MLSNFQIGTRSLVQSFLVGQPEFREIMQRPEMRQLKQRVIASYHLGPLDAGETRAYVEHRLHHVGWNDDPLLVPEAFDRIHHHTGGVPRRINTLCDRALLAAFLAEAHRIEGKDVDEVATELSEELGGLSADAAFAASPPTEVRRADDTSRLSQIEGRVALLEASASMTYGMLEKVLRVLRAQSKVERKLS